MLKMNKIVVCLFSLRQSSVTVEGSIIDDVGDDLEDVVVET